MKVVMAAAVLAVQAVMMTTAQKAAGNHVEWSYTVTFACNFYCILSLHTYSYCIDYPSIQLFLIISTMHVRKTSLKTISIHLLLQHYLIMGHSSQATERNSISSCCCCSFRSKLTRPWQLSLTKVTSTKICVNIMARPEENIHKYAGQGSVQYI